MAGETTELSTEVASTQIITEEHTHVHHDYHVEETSEETIDTRNSLTLSFAMLAGLGLTLMMVSAGIGVIQGEQADNSLLGLIFAAGVALMISGVVAWMGAARPWERFPSVTEGYYAEYPKPEYQDDGDDAHNHDAAEHQEAAHH
ncbi:MAG: hypothetical protein ACOCX3_01530 [Chloroflexota bacterium]